MSKLTYLRLSSSRPPVREQVVLGADDTVAVWRSNGPVVGRLAGRAEDGERLASLLASALGTPSPRNDTAPADAVFEVLEAGDTTVNIGPDGAPDGPWGSLVTACRDAVDHPGEPVAAIGLVIDAPGRLRLEHRGSGTLRVGLGAVAAETIVYRDGAQAGLAQSRFADGAVDAGPGWTHEIELDPVDAAGASVVASVSFSANDEGVWVPVRCEVTATG
jgi:hypothetical protein